MHLVSPILKIDGSILALAPMHNIVAESGYDEIEF